VLPSRLLRLLATGPANICHPAAAGGPALPISTAAKIERHLSDRYLYLYLYLYAGWL